MKFKSNIESQAGIEDSAGSAGTDGKILSSLGVDGNGVAGVEWIDQGDVVAGEADKAKSVTLRVKNSTASAMTKGQVICEAVSATPPSGNLIEVALADNNGTNKMPALGILNEDLDAAGGNNDEGDAIMFGKVSGINTSAFEVGDEVFVSDVPGGLTTTKPTGVKYIQKVGVVIRDDNNNGTIEVFGAGRVNDVPTPLYVDHANQRLGIGATNPDVRLHVDGGSGILVNNGGGETVLSANSNSGIFSIGDTGGLGDGVYATNTGTSYFDIYSDGSVKFRMDSNGNFGIGTGTSGLQAKLAVAGIVHVGEDFEVSDGLNGDKTLAIDPTVGAFQIGDIDGITDEAHIEGDGENIKIFNGGSLTLITDSGQNVGIGAPIPTQKLHVNGNARLTGLFYDGSNSGGTSGQILSSDGGQTEWIDGSAIPGVPAGSGTTNYLARWTPDANTLGTGVTYDNGTNVGIGITNPSAKLDVYGNLRLGTTGTFTIAQSPFLTTVFYVGAGSGSIITFGAPASNTQNVSVQGDLWSYQGSIGTKLSGSFNNKISYNGDNYLNSGNLGIGTTSPSEKLVVRNGTSNTDVKILAYNNAAGTEATLKFSTIASETNYEKAAIIARNAAGSFGKSDMHFALDSAADIGNVQFSDTKMTILNGGNVGIGTTDPNRLLTVETTGSGCYLALNSSSNNTTIGSDVNGCFIVYDDSNSTYRMVVDNSGSVGIGTTSPDARLEIAGHSSSGKFLLIDNVAGGETFLNVEDGVGSQLLQVKRETDNTISFNSYNDFNFVDNVGIKQTNPAYELDVNGTGRFTDILRSDKFLQIQGAGTTANETIGIGLNITDDFAYVGNDSTTRYLNHYGMGIHKPLQASISGGNGAYLSGYFGVDIFTTGNSRIHVNQNGRVGINQTNPSQTLDVNGEIHSSTYVSATAGLGVDSTSGQLGRGISLYGGPTLYPQYGLLFAQTVDLGTYGGVSGDWATYMTMSGTATRGWIWKARTGTNSTAGNVASISGAGQLTLASTATATNFILSSDETLKDNIKEIDTKHVDVDWKNFELKSEPGIKRAGVIAQELEIKHPEFVRTADDGLKSVAYIDLLITKIAELEARLEKLEK